MRAVLLGVSFALLSVIWSASPYALAADTKVARGTVVAMAGSSLTVKVRDQISGKRAGGTGFTQTFLIDENTRVFAKGAGTAAAAKRGRVPFTEIVTSGDQVTVSYHKIGDRLHASDVRVTMKAMH